MLTYFIAGLAAGALSALSLTKTARAFSGHRGVQTVQQLAVMEKVEDLESRLLQTVVPAIEKAAQESAALAEGVRQFEARTTSFQNACTTQLAQCVSRGEIAEVVTEMVTRPELELALQSAAQQILRMAQTTASASNGNGRALSALQEQVAGINQQLGLNG